MEKKQREMRKFMMRREMESNKHVQCLENRFSIGKMYTKI